MEYNRVGRIGRKRERRVKLYLLFWMSCFVQVNQTSLQVMETGFVQTHSAFINNIH